MTATLGDQRGENSRQKDDQTRTLDVTSATQPSDGNTIAVETRGPRDGSATLLISD